MRRGKRHLAERAARSHPEELGRFAGGTNEFRKPGAGHDAVVLTRLPAPPTGPFTRRFHTRGASCPAIIHAGGPPFGAALDRAPPGAARVHGRGSLVAWLSRGAGRPGDPGCAKRLQGFFFCLVRNSSSRGERARGGERAALDGFPGCHVRGWEALVAGCCRRGAAGRGRTRCGPPVALFAAGDLPGRVRPGRLRAAHRPRSVLEPRAVRRGLTAQPPAAGPARPDFRSRPAFRGRRPVPCCPATTRNQ